MTFAEYAAAALRTRLPSTMEPPGVYPALLLASEIEELARALRDNGKACIIDELGDVLWSAIIWAHDRDVVPEGAPDAAPIWAPGDWVSPLTALRVGSGSICAFEQRMMRDGGVAAVWRPTPSIRPIFQSVNGVALCLGSNVHKVAERNIAKLAGRAERGTISGAGER